MGDTPRTTCACCRSTLHVLNVSHSTPTTNARTNRQENITVFVIDGVVLDDPLWTMGLSPNWDSFQDTDGLLHLLTYREKYEKNLKRDLQAYPARRILLGFAKAGPALADRHVLYQNAPKYDQLRHLDTHGEPVNWNVEKMKLCKDKKQLIYNDFLTLDCIPAEVYDYRLGTRSALQWVSGSISE